MLEEAPFNLTQKIEKLQDGSWHVTAEMVDSRLLDSWISTWKEESQIRLIEKNPIGDAEPTIGGGTTLPRA